MKQYFCYLSSLIFFSKLLLKKELNCGQNKDVSPCCDVRIYIYILTLQPKNIFLLLTEHRILMVISNNNNNSNNDNVEIKALQKFYKNTVLHEALHIEPLSNTDVSLQKIRQLAF